MNIRKRDSCNAVSSFVKLEAALSFEQLSQDTNREAIVMNLLPSNLDRLEKEANCFNTFAVLPYNAGETRVVQALATIVRDKRRLNSFIHFYLHITTVKW